MDNLSILLVEDHRQLAQTVLEFLEQQGATVDYAGNTHLARELVKEHHYDLMLLDVMLPGESGFEFCRSVREELTLDMPVIFMTARDQLDDKLEGFRNGGDDYIVKPFALPELAARVSDMTRDKGLVFVPLSAPVRQRHIGIITRKSKSLSSADPVLLQSDYYQGGSVLRAP